MTVLENGLVSYLKATAGITTLVSSRIYPFMFPDGVTMPCLVYQRIDTPRTLTHDTSGATGDLAHPRFQFDAWAETYSEVKVITDALRAALNGKTGSIGSGANAFTIQAALVDNEAPEREPETKLYRGRSDYIIWHIEA